ncbi:MAG: thiolase family protein [Proteobacteria bacterium]|nr:thiolase family protein [Pseudomonadota bacterium]
MKSMFAKPIYVNAAYRSPIGKFGGGLKHLKAGQLAGQILKKAIEKTSAHEVDFVFLGHARQAGSGPNTARQATIFSGLSEKIPAWTLNQACASGLTAIMTGIDKIQLGQANTVWAGGVESMSNTPYLLMGARWGQRLGHGEVTDGMYQDGFLCPMAKVVMGETVEKFIVPEYKISREEQDAFALSSQIKTKKAYDQKLFNDEILATDASGKIPALSTDEHPRFDSTEADLKKLSPVFDSQNGSITAGNSSGITDGASFLLLSSLKNSNTLVEILDYQVSAVDPKMMGIGPVPATETLLKRQNLSVNDLTAVEINEAFAAQVIACQRHLKIPEDKLNIRGGSIALGHPIGATGARISTTLIHQIKEKSGALGLATLCVSGGMGVSILYRSL